MNTSYSAQLYSRIGPNLVDEGVVEESGPSHQKQFKVAVNVHGERFIGTGSSKKEAKNDACRMALEHVGVKRAAADALGDGGSEEDVTLPRKKRTCAYTTAGLNNFKEFAERHGKSALSVLNELEKGGFEWMLDKNESCRGPPHERIFKSKIHIGSEEFVGYGGRKQDSRQEAAFKVLQWREGTTSNVDGNGPWEDNPSVYASNWEAKGGGSGDVSNSVTAAAGVMVPSALQKLNEFHPGLEYIISETEGSRFHAEVTIGGQSFSGIGTTKQEARQIAAEEALRSQYGFNMRSLRSSMEQHQSNTQPLSSVCARVVEISSAKFTELKCNSQQTDAGRNIMAAFVMRHNRNWSVVALGTGTQITNAAQFGASGTELRDCHAEVVARRAFVRFLVRQLKMCIVDARGNLESTDWVDRSIFSISEGGQILLKPEVDFHFYVSAPPCGDAFVTGGRGCGQLRHKVPAGEGTEPSLLPINHSLNKWHRYGSVVMSCSDKILLWTALGVQGSLLSTVISPIYLQSIIVGAHFHETTARRALIDRLHGFAPQKGFAVCKPSLDGHPETTRRNVMRPAATSFNWSCGDETLELIDTATGHRKDGDSSRLCKRYAFLNFVELHSMLHELLPGRFMQLPDQLSYSQAKERSKSYRTAKGALLIFLGSKFGVWHEKPAGCDDFRL